MIHGRRLRVALGELRPGRLLRAFERGERWLYGGAARVIATTIPFCRHVDRVAGRPISVHVPNGALDQLVERPYRPPPGRRPFVVGYAGNLGLAQGLDGVLDAASMLQDADVRIVLVGDGPLRDYVRRAKDERHLDRLELRPGLPTAEIGDFLDSCDALLVPLGAPSRVPRLHPVQALRRHGGGPAGDRRRAR